MLTLESTYADGNQRVAAASRSVQSSRRAFDDERPTGTDVPACRRRRNDFRRDQIARRSRLNAKFTNPRESWNEMTNARMSSVSKRRRCPALAGQTATTPANGRDAVWPRYSQGLCTLPSLRPSVIGTGTLSRQPPRRRVRSPRVRRGNV